MRSSITLDDGRQVEYIDSVGGDNGTVVFHSGTPGGLVEFPPFAEAAADRGLRLLTVARPGYEGSTPRPGRSVADVVDDIKAVLDHLGISSYVSVGHSGGGPHALACRALDAPRCLAAVTLAGVGPYGEESLDFLAGMGESNVVEFGAAIAGEGPLTEMLEPFAEALANVDVEGVTEELDSLLPPADKAHLKGVFGEYIAALLRAGVAAGIAGWRDDDLAFAKRWGFDLTDLTQVSVWQGSDDLMVPFGHGQWLVEHLSDATPHLLDGEGHLSVIVGRSEDIFDEVAILAKG